MLRNHNTVPKAVERIKEVTRNTVVALGLLSVVASGTAVAQEAPEQSTVEFTQTGSESGEGGVTRYEGATRFDTAVEISRNRFPVDGSASAVFIVHEDGHDALAAAPAATAFDGPILFTHTDALPQVSAAEMLRSLNVQENVEQVYVIGGNAVISEDVEEYIQNFGYTTVRIAGPSRVETATKIAEQFILSQDGIGVPSAFMGDVYGKQSEALLAGGAASRYFLGHEQNGFGFVLPVNGSNDDASSSHLSEHALAFYNQHQDEIAGTYAIGINSIIAARTANIDAEEIIGSNTSATSVALAERFNTDDGYTPGIAVVSSTADALTATPHAVSYEDGTKNPAWMMFTNNEELSSSIVDYIEDRENTTFDITDAYIYGGRAAVSNAVSVQLSELLAE